VVVLSINVFLAESGCKAALDDDGASVGGKHFRRRFRRPPLSVLDSSGVPEKLGLPLSQFRPRIRETQFWLLHSQGFDLLLQIPANLRPDHALAQADGGTCGYGSPFGLFKVEQLGPLLHQAVPGQREAQVRICGLHLLDFITDGLLRREYCQAKRRSRSVIKDGFKDFEKRSVHVTTVSKPVEAHAIGDNTAWALGQWTQTFTGPDNTVKEVHGDSVVLAERDGDAWKWRLLIVNVASAPAATGTATPVPNDNTE
jgi:hypothetical protein